MNENELSSFFTMIRTAAGSEMNVPAGNSDTSISIDVGVVYPWAVPLLERGLLPLS